MFIYRRRLFIEETYIISSLFILRSLFIINIEVYIYISLFGAATPSPIGRRLIYEHHKKNRNTA